MKARFVDESMLRSKIAQIASNHGLASIEGQFVSALAVALETRLRNVVESATKSARDRAVSSFQPNLAPDTDVQTPFRIIPLDDAETKLREAAMRERAEEQKRKNDAEHRREQAAQLAAGGRKAPEVKTDRHKVVVKSVNDAAYRAAGGAKKAWMKQAEMDMTPIGRFSAKRLGKIKVSVNDMCLALEEEGKSRTTEKIVARAQQGIYHKRVKKANK
jgi:hypothetical protein